MCRGCPTYLVSEGGRREGRGGDPLGEGCCERRLRGGGQKGWIYLVCQGGEEGAVGGGGRRGVGEGF